MEEIKNDVRDDDCELSSISIITNADNATEENDDGWMYVVLGETGTGPSVVDLMTREDDRIPHLIWPTDSF